GGFASPAVHEALDLCVSCKGCRRECPTGVDMAKMKIEFQHAWAKTPGLSRKERLVAHLPRWAPWASRMPWLFNAHSDSTRVARVSERWLGFSSRRRLPRW